MGGHSHSHAPEPATPHRIDPLGPPESEWLHAHLDAAVEAGVDVDDVQTIGALFVAERAAWWAAPEAERPDANTAVNVVGIAFGEYVRRSYGLEWVVAVTDDGSEPALRRPAHDVLLYPVHLVAQKWTARSSGTIPQLAADLRSSYGAVLSGS